METAYNASRFTESISVAVLFCGILTILILFNMMLNPSLYMSGGTRAMFFSVTAVVRVRLHYMPNQQLAYTFFYHIWCYGVCVASVSMALAQNYYVLATGQVFSQLMLNAGFYVIGALYMRAGLAIPTDARWRTLACVAATRFFYHPPYSRVGQPLEALVISAALAFGEVLGFPLERRWRNQFLTRKCPAVPMHPVTLSLPDREEESAFRAERFTASFSAMMTFSLLFGALMMVHALAHPQAAYPTWISIAFLATMSVLRVYLHSMPDQAFAHAIFSWVWAIVASTVNFAIGIMQSMYGVSAAAGLSVKAISCAALLHMLGTLYMRRLAIPLAPRALQFISVATMRLSLRPPASELGQPSEGLLLCSAMLIGELIGHALEADMRKGHWEARRATAEAAAIVAQTRKQKEKVNAMLFPEGSAIAASVVAELVPPEVIAAGLDFDDFTFEKCVGEGSFSRVYAATYRGTPVAVKQLTRDRAELDVVRFVDEACIMRELSHPNVVRFEGAIWAPSAMLVLERLEISVRDALRDKRAVAPRGIAADVARGMTYLHALQLSHRDLKAANVLLDYSGRAKVGDLGLTRCVTTGMASEVGTRLWMAPEARSGRARYDERCDLFSFAVFLLELVDYDMVHNELAVDARFTGPEFFTPDLEWLGESWALPFIRTNWHRDPAQRQSFEELSRALDALLTTNDLSSAPPLPVDVHSKLLETLDEKRARVAELTRRRVRFGAKFGSRDSGEAVRGSSPPQEIAASLGTDTCSGSSPVGGSESVLDSASASRPSVSPYSSPHSAPRASALPHSIGGSDGDSCVRALGDVRSDSDFESPLSRRGPPSRLNPLMIEPSVLLDETARCDLARDVVKRLACCLEVGAEAVEGDGAAAGVDVTACDATLNQVPEASGLDVELLYRSCPAMSSWALKSASPRDAATPPASVVAHCPCDPRAIALVAGELSRLASLVDQTPDLLREIKMAEGKFRYIYASPSHMPILGTDPSYFTSLPDSRRCDIVHPDDAGILATKLAAWAAHMLLLPHVFEMRELQANGDYVTFEVILNPHPTRPERVALVLRAVTGRAVGHAQKVAASVEAFATAPELTPPRSAEQLEARMQILAGAQTSLQTIFCWSH